METALLNSPELFNISHRKQMAEKCLKYLWLFCKEILKYNDIDNEFHRRLCRHSDLNRNRDRAYFLPRGHLKSSIITIGETLQQIAEDPDKRHLILNAVSAIAESFASAMREHIENGDSFNYYFPQIRPPDIRRVPWNNTTFRVNRKNVSPFDTVTALGIDSAVTGVHVHRVVFDDIVDYKNSDNADKRNNVHNSYQMIQPVIEPGGRRVVCGTLYFHDDAYDRMIHEENYLVYRDKVFHSGDCYMNKGHLKQDCRCEYSDIRRDVKRVYAFPQKFSDDILSQRTMGMTPYNISCQYFNEPIALSTASFKKEYFHEIPPPEIDASGKPIYKPMTKVIAIDPAASVNAGSDCTAMVVAGMDMDLNRYMLEYRKEIMTPMQVYQAALGLYLRHHPIMIVVETQSGFAMYESILPDLAAKDNKMIPWKFVKSPLVKNAKTSRIMSMQPAYQSGLVFHAKGMEDLERQLLRVPKGQDDLADAAAWAFTFLSPPIPDEDEDEEDRNRYKPTFKKTGY